MYFWILYTTTRKLHHEVTDAVEFLKGRIAYTTALSFEQRNISVSVTKLRRIKHL